jgi:protein-arginine kinase activator protein McsA
MSNGTLSEEKLAEKPRDIFKELVTAISVEDYELASELRDEIDNDFGK